MNKQELKKKLLNKLIEIKTNREIKSVVNNDLSKEVIEEIKELNKEVKKNRLLNKRIILTEKQNKTINTKELEEKIDKTNNINSSIDGTLISGFKNQKESIFKQTSVLVSVIGSLFSNLTSFLTKLSNKIFVVQNTPEHYKTPQTFIQLDPNTNKPIDPNKKQPISVGVSMPSAQFNSLRTSIQDSLDQYKVNDVDESADPKYYGFSDKNGNWYILQNTSDTSFRYTKGDSDYLTNWTNRASLTYDLFHNIF